MAPDRVSPEPASGDGQGLATPGPTRDVVLEMLGLVPGWIGGMETYAQNLARELPGLDERYRYVVALGAEAAGVVPAGTARASEWIVDGSWPGVVRRIRPIRTVLQSMALARQIRLRAPDLVHSMLLFPKPPLEVRAARVVTIPDLNFELFPDAWHPLDRWIMSRSGRRARSLAHAIVTLSRFSRNVLLDRYDIAPDRVHVTPLGVSLERFSPASDPDARAALLHDLGMPGGFVFYPANTWPHKNHVRLLEALVALREGQGLRPGLVLTGAPKHAHAAVMAEVEARGLRDQVRWLGYVDPARLAALYQAADALVFPSLHEGFGVPIVEAMASGCPVVCSATTATGETAGDAALTFDPCDVRDLARTLTAVLTSPETRRDLARRGLARAALFTWSATARATRAVYDAVLSTQAPPSRRRWGGRA